MNDLYDNIPKESVTSEPSLESSDDVDEELEAMKARVQGMESEAAMLREMQAKVDHSMYSAEEDKETIDARSVHVGQVDYDSSPEELEAHFQSCGAIHRITILCDKFTGHSKGYAYVEFAEPSFVNHAVDLNGSLFRGRLLKVTPKRTNVPGFAARGRGAPYNRYRGRGRGHRMHYNPY